MGRSFLFGERQSVAEAVHLCYNASMVDTKHKFTSFAAPTPEDIAAFEALPRDEQRAIIEDEIAKGFEGETRAWTPELMREIRTRVLERHARKHAKD